jgi:hypothetical protein
MTDGDALSIKNTDTNNQGVLEYVFESLLLPTAALGQKFPLPKWFSFGTLVDEPRTRLDRNLVCEII